MEPTRTGTRRAAALLNERDPELTPLQPASEDSWNEESFAKFVVFVANRAREIQGGAQ